MGLPASGLLASGSMASWPVQSGLLPFRFAARSDSQNDFAPQIDQRADLAVDRRRKFSCWRVVARLAAADHLVT